MDVLPQIIIYLFIYLFIYYLFTLALWTSEVKKLLGLFSSPALTSDP